jgi:hypothetical protein
MNIIKSLYRIRDFTFGIGVGMFIFIGLYLLGVPIL